jgi:transposase
MSQKPITMEQLKQILQLKNDGVPIREIARRTGISRNAVKKYLRRLETSGDIEPAEDLTNKQLADKAYDNEALIFTSTRIEALTKHFMYAEKEIHKTGVNRQILWVEYKEQHSDGYNYSRYCYHFNKYLKHHDVAMHLEYEAGDIIMMDFAGKKLEYADADSGEVIECEVFISITPYSGLIYCKAVHSQKTPDFVSCTNAMLKFYGAVSKTMLCDNLKTAVTRPSKYEPIFTEICNQLSEHYQTTFSATRPYSPRDKAMVELAVSIVYTNIYAPLRNCVFFSLEQLNHAIHEQLNRLNNKPYKNGVHSRMYLYETLEQKVMKSLPTSSFITKKCVIVTIQRNYHVQLTEDRMYFSVPYIYVGKKVKVLYDNNAVEVYYDHARIALHIRKGPAKAYTTIDEHMPPNHLEMKNRKGWTREGLLKQAAGIGEYTCLAVDHMLSGSIYVEQNYKACYGMLKLEGKYTRERLEAACRRATNGTKVNYTMIKNILKNGLDKQPLLFDNNPLPIHENIRGSKNYQ